MSDIRSEQEALITYEVTRWLSAHCPEHESFTDACPACLSVPQCCPQHPMVNGGYPGFQLGCAACIATRPGSENLGEVSSSVQTAEDACRMFGIPYRYVKSGRVLRVPLNLLKRNSVSSLTSRP